MGFRKYDSYRIHSAPLHPTLLQRIKLLLAGAFPVARSILSSIIFVDILKIFSVSFSLLTIISNYAYSFSAMYSRHRELCAIIRVLTIIQLKFNINSKVQESHFENNNFPFLGIFWIFLVQNEVNIAYTYYSKMIIVADCSILRATPILRWKWNPAYSFGSVHGELGENNELGIL